MMTRRLAAIAAGAVMAVVLGGAVACDSGGSSGPTPFPTVAPTRAPTTPSPNAPFAASVNGEVIPTTDALSIIEQNQRVGALIDKGYVDIETIVRPSLDADVVTTQLIDRVLQKQEAARRNLSCTPDEVAALVDLQRKQQVQQVIVAQSIGYGIVPPSYVDTPEAEATPSAAEVTELYWQHPETLAGLERSCIRGKIINSLDDPTPDTPYDNADRANALAKLMEDLRSQGDIQRGDGY